MKTSVGIYYRVIRSAYGNRSRQSNSRSPSRAGPAREVLPRLGQGRPPHHGRSVSASRRACAPLSPRYNGWRSGNPSSRCSPCPHPRREPCVCPVERSDAQAAVSPLPVALASGGRRQGVAWCATFRRAWPRSGCVMPRWAQGRVMRWCALPVPPMWSRILICAPGMHSVPQGVPSRPCVTPWPLLRPLRPVPQPLRPWRPSCLLAMRGWSGRKSAACYVETFCKFAEGARSGRSPARGGEAEHFLFFTAL